MLLASIVSVKSWPSLDASRDFAVTFETGVPALLDARRQGLSWTDAAVETFLTLLEAGPDTHIARKLGAVEAQDVSRRAGEVRAAGGTRSASGREALLVLDRELRDPRNRRNPGSTADLTCAALFVVILEGGWDR